MKATKKHLSTYDWLLLGKLLTYTIDLQQCLHSLYQMVEKERLLEIAKSLTRGEKLSEILKEDAFEKEVGFYCDMVDLSEAIEIAYQKKQRSKKLQSVFVQKLAYSVVLFVASLIVLSLFSDMVLPMMISVSGGKQNAYGIVVAFQVIALLKNILLILLLVFLIFMCYVQIKNRWRYLWLFLHRIKKDDWLKMIATYQFVEELSIMLEQNISLLKALEAIRYDAKKPLAALIAAALHRELMEGIDFEHCIRNEFFDEGFTAIVIFGLQQDHFSASLKQYQQIVEDRIEHLIGQLALRIQIVCYLFVILVILVSYRVLLLPLEMLNGF